jgi:hypothetical protein
MSEFKEQKNFSLKSEEKLLTKEALVEFKNYEF